MAANAGEMYEAFMAGWQAAQEEDVEEHDDLDAAAENKFLAWLFEKYPPQFY